VVTLDAADLLRLKVFLVSAHRPVQIESRWDFSDCCGADACDDGRGLRCEEQSNATAPWAHEGTLKGVGTQGAAGGPSACRIIEAR